MVKGLVSWARLIDGDIEKTKTITQFHRYEANGEDLAKIIERHFWSPIIWKGNRRKKVNYEFSDFCALDFENPEVSISQIERKFCDSWFLLGTTRNHQKQKDKISPMDRFRLVLKWDRRITDWYQYERNTLHLAEEYGADYNACDAARHFFPSKFYSSNLEPDLFLQPVIAFAQPVREDFKEIQKNYHHHGVLSPMVQFALLNDIPAGVRNVTFFKVACELARAGISLDDAQCRILSSPTFQGKSDSLEFTKTIGSIRTTIRSAYKNEAEKKNRKTK